MKAAKIFLFLLIPLLTYMDTSLASLTENWFVTTEILACDGCLRSAVAVCVPGSKQCMCTEDSKGFINVVGCHIDTCPSIDGTVDRSRPLGRKVSDALVNLCSDALADLFCNHTFFLEEEYGHYCGPR